MKNMNSLRLLFATIVTVLFVLGCGGGGDSISSYQVNNGVAQKGALLQGSEVTINELSWNTYVQNGKSYTFQTIDNFGTFNTSNVPFSSPYLMTSAQGYYFNELTGSPSTDLVFLRGLSNIDINQDEKINVNILSSFTKNRTLSLASSTNVGRLSFTEARGIAQRELLQNFYIYNYQDLLGSRVVGGIKQPTSFTALDLSSQRVGDQILAALSGVVMRITQLGVSLNTFLSEVENDLTDDGILNATSTQSIITATTTFSNLNATSTRDLFCAAFKSTNFNVVASNLNKFYKTNYQSTDLSQWVDSSGCVDKVIDKFKFSSTDGKQGYASKSPYYTVSSDDIGQCLTLNSNSENSITGLYQNSSFAAVQNSIGQNYYGGAVKASADDKFSLGITGLQSSVFTAYLQRFAPVNGSCSSIPASGARVNLMKFTLTSK
jgi:hypothetical protein